MQFERAVGLGVFAVLSTSALLAGASALGLPMPPGSGGPSCEKKIVLITYMASQSNGCSSYTDCDQSYACQDGTLYNNCGPLDDEDIFGWCGDYENGTWDANLGRCVGGHLSGSYYDNGYIPAYPNPVFCDP